MAWLTIKNPLKMWAENWTPAKSMGFTSINGKPHGWTILIHLKDEGHIPIFRWLVCTHIRIYLYLSLSIYLYIYIWCVYIYDVCIYICDVYILYVSSYSSQSKYRPIHPVGFPSYRATIHPQVREVEGIKVGIWLWVKTREWTLK